MPHREFFSLQSKVAIVTGATGALGSAMAHGLANAGARVGILARRADQVHKLATAITGSDGEALPLSADVLQREQLEAVRSTILDRWGRIDILVNAAGGNVSGATVSVDTTFFNLPQEALEAVIDLNLLGTLLPCQVFGKAMAEQREGSIVTVSSMAADRALTRVVGYGAAKAAVESLTRWLAVEMARAYGEGIRVNAIAPGFFVGDQNRSLLLEPDDSLTARGQTIINHTPMGRFGEPDDLVGTVLWLCSPASRFVTGVVVPIDGGFSAFSGV